MEMMDEFEKTASKEREDEIKKDAHFLIDCLDRMKTRKLMAGEFLIFIKLWDYYGVPFDWYKIKDEKQKEEIMRRIEMIHILGREYIPKKEEK